MHILYRLFRALWVFGLILSGYLSQLALAQLLGEVVKDESGREHLRIPRWLERRRERLDERNADRLYEGMVELRGVFIKLGQILSITGAILPRVYSKRLEKLQDQVPPRPFEEIRRGFEESLGRRPEDCYARIESTPLASASLGQVHVAWLHPEPGETEGRKVAVKVLYPGIRDVIAVDMQVIRLAVLVYRAFVPVDGVERVHDALVDLLRRETDYLHEARCMQRMAANFAKEKDLLFPEVVPELTSRDVLTMTFMEGIKINQVEQLRAANIDPSAVATRFVEATYKMIFVDRLFHADPHPGNFLVQPGRSPRRPKIVVLDFGAISEVQQSLVDGMLEVIGGLLEKDGPKLLRGFYQMGFASREANHELLEKTVYTYFQKLLSISQRTPGALMRANTKELEGLVDPEVARDELRELMRSVAYPDGWFYVERAAVLSFWLVGQLDPELDAMQVGYPYVMPLLTEKRRKDAEAAALAAAAGADASAGESAAESASAADASTSEPSAPSDAPVVDERA